MGIEERPSWRPSLRSGDVLRHSVKWQLALCIGLVSALLFAGLASVNLTAQGLYYDELHQATASFAYIGTKPEMFSGYEVNGFPILNMPYSGAIKTAVYGLFLRYSGSPFTVTSWRLLGILFVAAGLLLYCVIARRGLSLGGILAFLLVLTDATVILATRHDWGPVALALLFRLLFIATWIYGEVGQSVPLKNTFVLGTLFGLAVFEKASSVILVIPLLLILCLGGRRMSPRHWLACATGCIFGGLPLILVNLDTYRRMGILISLNGPPTEYHASFSGFAKYVSEYLTLGNGALLRSFILGRTESIPVFQMEGILVAALLLLTAIVSVANWRTSKPLRMSGIMLLSYAGVGLGMYLLPLPTWVHHWVIGTPFQYAAVSLGITGLLGVSRVLNYRERVLRSALLLLVALLAASRLIGAASLEDSLARGDASATWDSSLSEIGYFAAQHADEAVFIAADWGVATQIYALANGQPGLVYQFVWNYRGQEELDRIVKNTDKNTLYLVVKKPLAGVNPEVTEKVTRDIEQLAGWEEMPVENDVSALTTVGVRKFSRVTTGSVRHS